MIKWLLSLFRGRIIDDGEPHIEPMEDKFSYMVKVTCGDKHYFTTVDTDRLGTTINYTCARCNKVTRLTHPGYLWVSPKSPRPILNLPLLSWGGHSFSIDHWIQYNYASTVQPDTYPRYFPDIPG